MITTVGLGLDRLLYFEDDIGVATGEGVNLFILFIVIEGLIISGSSTQPINKKDSNNNLFRISIRMTI